MSEEKTSELIQQAQKDLQQLRENLEVAHQIADSFWGALKELNLPAINVQDPGQHIRDLIRDRHHLADDLTTINKTAARLTVEKERAERERDEWKAERDRLIDHVLKPALVAAGMLDESENLVGTGTVDVALKRLHDAHDALKDEVERLRVQLAGCSVAAMGVQETVHEGAYGWSAAYRDVVKLYREFEIAKAAAFYAFVAGAKWWEFAKTGATMWPSDVRLAEAEARRIYPFVPHPILRELEVQADELFLLLENCLDQLRACGLGSCQATLTAVEERVGAIRKERG